MDKSQDTRETQDIHHLHAPIMREHREPRDGYEPIPPWIAIFYGIIIFWGGFYLARYSGDFRGDIYDENYRGGAQLAEEKEIDPKVEAQTLYTMNCVACHKQTGVGAPGQFPPLVNSKWVTGDPGIPIRILLQGLQGPIEVQGETYNGNMPEFGSRLNDKKIALVLTHIRTSWGNQAAEIKPEEVSFLRKTTKSRSAPWSAEELEGVPPLQAEMKSTENAKKPENQKSKSKSDE